jgi:hypothetical protein
LLPMFCKRLIKRDLKLKIRREILIIKNDQGEKNFDR